MNTNFQRAGEVLIKCIWIEKRLIDLILLKHNQSLKDEFNMGTISPMHRNLRLEWHKNTFSYVIDFFLSEFPEIKDKDERHIENILFLNEIRDLIAHCDISYHRDTLLFVSKNANRLTKMDNITFPNNSGHDDGTRGLNLVDEKTFSIIASVICDWEKIIESYANFFGIYSKRIW
jgi:hypothetical protein